MRSLAKSWTMLSPDYKKFKGNSGRTSIPVITKLCDVEKSLLNFGSVNEHVEVVLFVPAKKSLPPKANFKPPLTSEDMKTRGFEGYFTVCGDHTQRAMNQLHRRFPLNPKWATLSCMVVVCQRTADSYSALKSWESSTTSRVRSK